MSSNRTAVVQKLAKRAAQAQRQATRRADKFQLEAQKAKQANARRYLKEAVTEVKQNLRDARLTRNEAWDLGPLAPKRDLGFNGYGEISSGRRDWTHGGQWTTNSELAQRRCAWAGGVKQFCLAPGDRVVLLEGQDKGRIDRIKEVDPEHGFVLLQKLNRAVDQPAFANMPLSSNPYPLSADAVRLVYPIKNPTTGATRDVIINQLKPVAPNMKSSNMTIDRWYHGNRWDRIAPGVNIAIPWPETEAPELETYAIDTARDLVENRTFYYNLSSPPVPDGVLDELRNPYSRFRTRHEEWYIVKKEQEAIEKLGRHKMLETMQMPLEEFHEKQRRQRASQPEPELTQDMLEKIGEVMAKNKSLALGRAGMSEVAPQQTTPLST